MRGKRLPTYGGRETQAITMDLTSTTYRGFIRDHYDGFAGALTAVTGFLTGHEALAGRLIRPGAFDVRGCKRILDAGCGNGRYSRFLLEQADQDAVVTG